jgi:hypothetical protein
VNKQSLLHTYTSLCILHYVKLVSPSTPKRVIIRLRERGVKQGEGRNSTIGERHRIVPTKLTLGQLAYTLRWLLERADEQIWECPDCCDTTPDNS